MVYYIILYIYIYIYISYKILYTVNIILYKVYSRIVIRKIHYFILITAVIYTAVIYIYIYIYIIEYTILLN